ncbi:MAG TPA: TonB-dependent receptor [Vicinamibacterales bacterium]|nr:TonB-dependent receptor [Vicinamibacterales bacterium]
MSKQRLCTLLVLVSLSCTSAAYAQIRSATITGTVTDPQKATVPGATVVITNQDTNVSQEIVTNETGLFTAPLLQAGTYSISVTLQGFAPFKRTGVVVAATETVRIPVELTVSQLGETVEVSAEAPLLQTDKTSVSNAVSAEMIEALPNITQNPLAYATFAGGVPRVAAADTTSINSFGIGVDGRRQWSAVGINGGRAFTNDIQLDGLPVMGGGYNEASVVPNTEGLQEVRVIQNNFSAEYGRGQAIISMSTKSGTNAYRGNGVYMLRHEKLDANSFANNAQNIDKRPFRVDDAGGSIGGPIIRNKLFFFSSYHGLRNDQTTTSLMTVPTALERVGNFSQTLKPDENGNPIPVRIYDPFNVTQINADLYRRAEIPNAIIPNANPYAVRMFSYYPLPNRTPDDVYNANNFESTTTTTVRRHSNNNRVDLKLGSHSIYGSGGISYAEIITPRPFGEAPFNDAPGVRSDKNPYIQIGDAVVLSPTLVLDVRYGLSRINTKNLAGNKEGFTDYASFGVPDNLLPLILFPGTAPNINPNGYGGGGGGGSNWTALTTGNFNTKREFQTSHSITGSVTKMRGKWQHKAGLEFRNLLSNYADPEQGSVAMPSPFAHQGGNFNFEYVTASGNVASQTSTNAQRGVNAAGMLLGTGVWWIRPGANVNPAFSQKYFAVYSQNEWRATSKLTVNLGLRWEVQPGPTERFNRMSSWDFTAENSFGSLGAIAFPGEDGYSRNLWDTTYDNWGPRVGATYQLNDKTVLRGGFGITYLPTNTGYFSGPTDYGSANFSGGVTQTAYGSSPAGVPVIRFSDPAPIAPAIGGDESNPGVYGIGEARFDRHLENGQARQWNFFIERALSSRWTASIGYSASVSRNLHNRSFPIQNLQSLDPGLLSQWRDQYIASGGTLNPSTQLVQNPVQPATGPLVPFAGVLGQRTIQRQNTYFPYPLLVGSNAAVNLSQATADYHAMLLRVTRRFANGFMLDANYTWSKNIDNTDTVEDNQGFNAGGGARGANHYLYDFDKNRRLGYSDVPHRFVATFLYELPFGKGKPIGSDNALVSAIAGGWQLGGAVIWQTGFPIAITGASDGAALARPNRVPGVDLVLPENLWGWYDGNTRVTLPSGRVITPPARTYLKYNPDAFAGQIITLPDGRNIVDQFWYGDAAITYDEIRTDNRFNIDMSIRREFPLPNDLRLEFGADAMNILNHTQFNGSFNGALGGTVTNPTAAQAALGLRPGMGNSNSYGTRGTATYNPRQISLRASIRF